MNLLPDYDWSLVSGQLRQTGYALPSTVFSSADCADLITHYGDETVFRKTIDMAQYRFERGKYKYFGYPLPPVVNKLRADLYSHLAPVANAYLAKLALPVTYPPELSTFLAYCAKHGQARPTPLLLRYGPGGYNALHQDLYGEVFFPFQAAAYTGYHFPRRQMIRHIELGYAPVTRLRRLAELRRDGVVSLGGNSRQKIYGTLTCRSDRRLTVANRVFFRDVPDAEAHGYRPCGHCLRAEYTDFVQNRANVERPWRSSGHQDKSIFVIVIRALNQPILEYMKIVIRSFLLSGITACAPCLEYDPVTYYFKFRLVDVDGTDWFIRHKQYRPDSLNRFVPISTGAPVLAKCPFDKVDGDFVFDCDITFGSVWVRERAYLIKLKNNDIDTLTLRMDKRSSGGRCGIDYTSAVTLVYDNRQVFKLDSERDHLSWQELAAKQYTVAITKDN